MTVIYSSDRYVIEYCPGLHTKVPYALDRKEQSGDQIALVNVGWYATEAAAYAARNVDAGYAES